MKLKVLICCSEWILRDIPHLHHNALKRIQNQAVGLFYKLGSGDSENNRNEKRPTDADDWLYKGEILRTVDTYELKTIKRRETGTNFVLCLPVVQQIDIESEALGWLEIFSYYILLRTARVWYRKQEDGVVVLRYALVYEEVNTALIYEPIALLVIDIRYHIHTEFLHEVRLNPSFSINKWQYKK